jgi:hypothetical protein
MNVEYRSVTSSFSIRHSLSDIKSSELATIIPVTGILLPLPGASFRTSDFRTQKLFAFQYRKLALIILQLRLQLPAQLILAAAFCSIGHAV